MIKKILWVILFIVIIAGVWWFFKGNEAIAPEQSSNNATTTNESADTGEPVDDPDLLSDTIFQEFNIKGSNFKFSQDEIKVKEGDKVRITFTNEVGMHDLRIDGYGWGTKVLKAGESETFEFVADQKGTFEYYCSVGSHRAMGMKGNFIVE